MNETLTDDQWNIILPFYCIINANPFPVGVVIIHYNITLSHYLGMIKELIIRICCCHIDASVESTAKCRVKSNATIQNNSILEDGRDTSRNCMFNAPDIFNKLIL